MEALEYEPIIGVKTGLDADGEFYVTAELMHFTGQAR